MRILFGGVAVLVLLTACASSSATYGPDGRRAYTLNCSGWARSWGMCYEKAGELCGTQGYDVVNRNESPVFLGGTLTSSRSMTVACRSVAAPAPTTTNVAATPPPAAPPPRATLDGTFSGEITGNSAGQIFTMRVTFTVIQSDEKLLGTWTTTGGTSGTLTGILTENGIRDLRIKQVGPCDGDFGGIAVLESANRLRGSYVGNACNGSITASFTVTRQ